MKQAVVVASPRSEHQQRWGSAFASGLRRHGWRADVLPRPAPCDMLVLWGVRQRDAIARQKAAGGEVCILERGYLGDRFAWTSVSFGGGLNGRGRFYGPLDDGARWERYFAHLMRDWRPMRAGYALIMGQVPTDMSLDGLRPQETWQGAADGLRGLGWQVSWRPHPKAPTVRLRGVNAHPADESLESALAGAAMALTINSNAAVDAVMAGVPTVTLDYRSMAWAVTGHEVRYPPTPEREAWARAMAWKQWTMDEMGSGYCWANVGERCGLDQDA